MTTSELIAQLREADPTGDVQVVVGNQPVYCVNSLPGYYDGCYQVLLQAASVSKAPSFAVVGARYCAGGAKISIETYSVDDLLLDDPEALVEYDGDYARRHNEERVATRRQQCRDVVAEVRTKMNGESR